jgi:hypothetical protein
MATLGKLPFALAAAVMAAGLLAAPAQAAPICGPGAHWIDSCGAGLDTFWSSATVGIDLNFDSTSDLTLVLSGPTTVQRSGPLDDSANFPGLRPVDGHLDVIDTEIVALTLTGSGVTLRAGAGFIASGLPSSGAIAEQPGDPTIGDSFFDVFFEIDISGMTLHNEAALRLEAQILEVPPLDIDYVHPLPGPVPLLNVQGTPVAQLINAVHTPIPEPATLTLFGIGLAGLGFLWRRTKAA